jgi:hypothetical protein
VPSKREGGGDEAVRGGGSSSFTELYTKGSKLVHKFLPNCKIPD